MQLVFATRRAQPHSLVSDEVLRDVEFIIDGQTIDTISQALLIDVALVKALAEKIAPGFDAVACKILSEPKSTYAGITFTTETYPEVLIGHPLEDLPGRLDPRRWDRCRTFFKRTHHVALTPSLDYTDVPAGPHEPQAGESWHGLLDEEVELPMATFR